MFEESVFFFFGDVRDTISPWTAGFAIIVEVDIGHWDVSSWVLVNLDMVVPVNEVLVKRPDACIDCFDAIAGVPLVVQFDNEILDEKGGNLVTVGRQSSVEEPPIEFLEVASPALVGAMVTTFAFSKPIQKLANHVVLDVPKVG